VQSSYTSWLLFFSAKKKLSELVKKTVNNRRKQKTDKDEHLLIDALLDFSSDEELIFSDSTSFVIGGFHTTGNRESACRHFTH
jgi:cytochrome P450